MNIKLIEVMNSYNTMANIVMNKEVRTSVKLAYAIARNMRLMEPEVRLFDEKRKEIIGDVDIKDVKPEQEKQIADLLNSEIELSLQKVKLSDAGETFSPSDMLYLFWMFTEEGEN